MCFRFIPNHPDSCELRGAPAFRVAAKWQRIAAWLHLDDQHDIIIQASSGEVRIRPCERWFVLMPGNTGMARLIESRLMAEVVVDYHGDVLNLLSNTEAGEAMRTAGDTNTPESRAFWKQPKVQGSLITSLQSADVITTPWPELVPKLLIFGHPVVLLPDTHPGKLRPFRKAWKNVNKALTT